jgi:uncharacterized Zn-binding protein involved in type VI secretion
MSTVAVNPPKTPVTKGSNSLATATLPNICKMPGPPAPFVPTPLPNIGQGSKDQQGYSTTVEIEGQAVAITGATFGSVGDIASQGTGGGLVSSNVQGPTSFVAPGSLNVMIEGKNVQYLGDQMLNNCGPGGSPANSATMGGVIHVPLMPDATPEAFLKEIACRCDKKRDNNSKNGEKLSCMEKGTEKHACCEDALQRHKASGRTPAVGGEEGYSAAGNKLSPPSRTTYRAEAPDFLAGSAWPDAASLDGNGNPTQLFDFKFRCSPGGEPVTWKQSRGLQAQGTKYRELSVQLGIDPEKKKPTIVDNTACP